MYRRDRLRRLALTLRAAGLALIGVSFMAASLQASSQSAAAAPWDQFRNFVSQVMPVPGLGTPVPLGTVTPSPTPVASGSPKPQATLPPPAVQRGGPLSFALTGGLSLGESSQTHVSDFGGGFGSLTSSTTTANAGLLAKISRRTASTTTSLQVPFGLSLQHGTLGQGLFGYYTPTYGFEYGPQPLSLLGAISLGTTQRSFGLILPLRGGDLTFFRGPVFGQHEETLNLDGVRLRRLSGNTLFEFGADYGTSKQGERDAALVLGAANFSRLLSQSFEAALEHLSDGTQSQGAGAYQYRVDYGGSSLYTSLTLHRNSDDFLSFGGGQILSDSSVDSSIRDSFGPNAVSIEETLDQNGDGTERTTSRRGAFSFSHLFERQNMSVQLIEDDQRRQSAQGLDWNGMLGTTLGVEVGQTSAILGAQFQRTTSSYTFPTSLTTYTGNVQRSLGDYLIGASYQSTRQTGAIAEVQAQSAFGLTRNFGLTSITLRETALHTISGLTNSLQTSPTISVARRLSPALTLALTYGIERTRDKLNPSANGHSRIFQVQIAAPFAIGSGIVSGRANPRLPATISGLVTSEVSGNGGFSIASTGVGNGLSNVAVILDHQQVQRTDLSGQFQFNFVAPGHHTIELDTSSLPRGLIPDQPVATIDVLGGQTAQVAFAVGNFGAIEGHVMGRDADGNLVGISGVTLTVDKNGAIATTGPDGLYGFGKLSPGTHTVALQVTSLPATVAIPQDKLSQQVQVRNGQYATADFVAGPLGSIAGFVVYGPELAPKHTGGAYNAYVVAEPGDYAAIADEDGSFVLDNLPPGTYTLSVDEETIPDDTGASGTQTVNLGASDHVEGIRFVLGHREKAIVFTFNGGGSGGISAAPAQIGLENPILPPGGATVVTVNAGVGATRVVVAALSQTQSLTYDKTLGEWTGMLDVPVHTPAGAVKVTASVEGAQKSSISTNLRIDPHIPVATFSTMPRQPAIGQIAAVRARFLADVHPGDTIRWFDGQLTKLSRPLTGRVYEFTVKISERPMHGTLLTRQGELPITLR